MPSRKSSFVIAVAALLVVVIAFWAGFVAYPFLAPRLTGSSRPSSVQTTIDRNTYLKLSGEVLSLIHISEPTRLGMISYAVFCLKKKKKKKTINTKKKDK